MWDKLKGSFNFEAGDHKVAKELRRLVELLK